MRLCAFDFAGTYGVHGTLLTGDPREVELLFLCLLLWMLDGHVLMLDERQQSFVQCDK